MNHGPLTKESPPIWSHGTHHLEGYLDFEDRRQAYAQALDFWANDREKRGHSRTLEVGCAAGAFLRYLNQITDGDDLIVALDVDQDILLHAKSEPVSCGSATDLPFAEHSFDYVFMVSVLHHLVGPSLRDCRRNWTKALSDAVRVCRPGGYVLVSEGLAVRARIYQRLIFSATSWLSNHGRELPILHIEHGEVLAFLTPSDLLSLANSIPSAENVGIFRDPRQGTEFDRLLSPVVKKAIWSQQTFTLGAVLRCLG